MSQNRVYLADDPILKIYWQYSIDQMLKEYKPLKVAECYEDLERDIKILLLEQKEVATKGIDRSIVNNLINRHRKDLEDKAKEWAARGEHEYDEYGCDREHPQYREDE